MNDGTSVSCYLYDRLKEIANLKCQCTITYIDLSHKFIKVHGRIVDMYSTEDKDWCKLDDGTVINLDRIEDFES